MPTLAAYLPEQEHWAVWLSFRDLLREQNADPASVVAHALSMAAAVHIGSGGSEEDLITSMRLAAKNIRDAAKRATKGDA